MTRPPAAPTSAAPPASKGTFTLSATGFDPFFDLDALVDGAFAGLLARGLLADDFAAVERERAWDLLEPARFAPALCLV